MEALWEPAARGGIAIPRVRGAGIEDDPERIRALQVLRMLELLAGDPLDEGVRGVVTGRLRATL